MYHANNTDEKGMVKVRFSPFFRDTIEIEVELAPVPIDDE